MCFYFDIDTLFGVDPKDQKQKNAENRQEIIDENIVIRSYTSIRKRRKKEKIFRKKETVTDEKFCKLQLMM